ncbi:hypothetical protein [Aquabacterium sp.]|uniref:hypothetical protein n=1 Tax=Aquabacterium sp. TaxID=1872578 RepID=UPI003783B2EE
MSRIDELKAQIAQLDDLLKSGALTSEAAHVARQHLEQQLLAEVMQGAAPAPTPTPAPALAPVATPAHDAAAEPPARRPSGALVAGLLAFVVVFAAGGYAWLGNREGLRVEPGAVAAQAAGAA